jgi:hypothetical protein
MSTGLEVVTSIAERVRVLTISLALPGFIETGSASTEPYEMGPLPPAADARQTPVAERGCVWLR